MSVAKTAVTFRTPLKVKQAAAKAARKVGVPLSLVLTNALKDFAAKPKVTLTENGFTREFEKETSKVLRNIDEHPERIKKLNLSDLN